MQRWDPEAALQQKAQALLRALAPQRGDTVSLLLDDSKQATRGQHMDAVATLTDPTTAADLRGHPYVWGTRRFRPHVIPWGLRLYVTQEAWVSVGVSCRTTTAWAAQLRRECNAPAGGKVVVWFDASSRGRTVVQAGREPRVHFASTLQSHRNLWKPGWQLKAGRSGRPLFRRRRSETLVITKPHGSTRDRFVDAGWLTVGQLGLLPVVFARQGTATQILGLVTDAPERSAARLLQTSDRRWTIDQWGKAVKQLRGLGHDQKRSSRAAVIHLPLVGCASALLTHRRIERAGAQGHRTRDQAADLSTAAAQDQLRSLLWEALRTYLQEEGSDQPMIEERERLRVA